MRLAHIDYHVVSQNGGLIQFCEHSMPYAQIFDKVFYEIWVESYLKVPSSLLLCRLSIPRGYHKVIYYDFL